MDGCYWCDRSTEGCEFYDPDDEDLWPIGWLRITEFGSGPVIEDSAVFCSIDCARKWLEAGRPTPEQRRAAPPPES